MLEKLFKLKENKTDVKTEILAGIECSYVYFSSIICVEIFSHIECYG